MSNSLLNGIDWQTTLDMTNLKAWSFVGRSGAGACTLTGAKVGSVVMSVTGLASGTAGNQAAKFEGVITVADQIRQVDAGNLSANTYMVLVYLKE